MKLFKSATYISTQKSPPHGKGFGPRINI